MENKENYSVKLDEKQMLSSNYLISSFYDDLTSTNVISTTDVNKLIYDTNFCINTLSSICTNEFCQLCQNTFDYYITLTDQVFPRVKYYNGKTGAASAVFNNSKINDILLRNLTSINLITYKSDQIYHLVTNINGDKGDISGITNIVINGRTFQYNQSNKGRINLGNYQTIDSLLISINGQSGILFEPKGIQIEGRKINCNNNGLVDITNKINQYITTPSAYFDNLYVNAIKDIPTAVINLDYLKQNVADLKVKTFTITDSTLIDIAQKKVTVSGFTIDSNFLSFIYGMQDNQHKTISAYIPGDPVIVWDQNYYQKGIPLTFVLLESNGQPCKLKLDKIGTNWDTTNPVVLSYSLNYGQYHTFPNNDGIDVKVGDIISLSGLNDHFSQSETKYYKLDIKNSTKFACYGNIMSLVNWDTEIRNDYQFTTLFAGTNIVKAPQLPATTLTQSCYSKTFSGCAQLIVPPQLPATTMKTLCYYCMFNDCSSLSSVPLLPAMQLAPSCYYAMFWGCESLRMVPYYLLPATELKDWCYTSMFGGCTNLTDSPLLPANISAYNSDGTCAPNYINCYGNMFYRSPKLSAIHVNCTPGLLLQKPLPSDMPTTTEEQKAVARNWLQTHNYANEWLYNFRPGIDEEGVPNDDHTNITMYNTALWNEMRGYANGVEKFYYSPYTNDNFNYYNVKTIARSLEDTPLSFELLQGKDGAAFCYRSLQYILSSGTTKNHSYNNNKDIVKNMNAKLKYYDKNTKALVTSNAQDADGWRKQEFSWTTTGTSYTLSHDKFPFNNIGNKNGLIFSFKSDYFSQGYDSEKDRILFWRLCHTKDVKLKIMGNINSLIGYRNEVRPYQFFGIFSNLNCGNSHYTHGFVDAHQLILPAKVLGKCCYQDMFNGDYQLSIGPLDLPATTPAPSCYYAMFMDCNSLKIAPSIYTETLDQKCFTNMFNGCSILVIPPSIKYYYNTSINCCWNMFKNCYKLKYYQDLVVDNIEEGSYYQMFFECKQLITPPSLVSFSVKSRSCHQMFNDCYALTYIPPLPITSVTSSCYYNMFKNCKNVNISPHVYLPATRLEDKCYYGMFNGTYVNDIVVKFTNWKDVTNSRGDLISNSATYDWLKNVKTTTGTICCYPSLSISIDNGKTFNDPHIPNNWDVKCNTKTTILKFKDSISTDDMKIFYLTK